MVGEKPKSKAGNVLARLGEHLAVHAGWKCAEHYWVWSYLPGGIAAMTDIATWIFCPMTRPWIILASGAALVALSLIFNAYRQHRMERLLLSAGLLLPTPSPAADSSLAKAETDSALAEQAPQPEIVVPKTRAIGFVAEVRIGIKDQDLVAECDVYFCSWHSGVTASPAILELSVPGAIAETRFLAELTPKPFAMPLLSPFSVKKVRFTGPINPSHRHHLYRAIGIAHGPYAIETHPLVESDKEQRVFARVAVCMSPKTEESHFDSGVNFIRADGHEFTVQIRCWTKGIPKAWIPNGKES